MVVLTDSDPLATATAPAHSTPADGAAGDGAHTSVAHQAADAPPAPPLAATDDSWLRDAAWAYFGATAAPALPPDQVAEPALLEMLFADDDRREVSDTTAYPWRAICSLIITAADNSQWSGTACFVGPRLLLTAGHCLYLKDNGGWVKSVEVIPGRRGSSKPFRSCMANTFRTVEGWIQAQTRECDYGAIILPANCRLGEQVGWFGYTTKCDQALNALSVTLSGYPDDKPTGTHWVHAQPIHTVSAGLLGYTIDSAKGQSGAPVWLSQANGQPLVVGIHIGHHTDGALTENCAVRITPAVFSILEQWQADARE